MCPTSLVSHADMSEELKEGILRCHSKKLAIAFGLVNAPPGTILRVVKNLRLRADCHFAAKYISLVYNRDHFEGSPPVPSTWLMFLSGLLVALLLSCN